MRRLVLIVGLGLVAAAVLAATTIGRDKPASTAELIALKLLPAPEQFDLDASGQTDPGGQFSKEQIERFRCSSAGNPAAAVDISCNDPAYGQDFNPDNEIAVAVDPENPNHLVAGSNDYFYRFNNSTGARQALVPTGFFTSFDGGATWTDGQIPMRSGNGAGDPAPAFDAKHDVALMAQLENVGGQGGPFVSQGDVSVSRSADGGLTWSEPVTVMKGADAGIGPANNAVFWDKEWLAVDNSPSSPYYGRAYVVATKFTNGLHGSYERSPIALSFSDDGGLTWSEPREISGFHPSCTFQSAPSAAGECDEDQFGIPDVASNGTVYVHFHNYQNEAAWENGDLFDAQIMVVKSTDGGLTWSAPVPAVQVEDGYNDMPFSVIRRQTVWGHQIRWGSAGNLTVDPTNGSHVVVVFSDRGTPNPNASDGCFLTATGGLNIGTAPTYDPCGAGPGSDTNVYKVESFDGGATWSSRAAIAPARSVHEWFPWADFKPNGKLVVAWDRDTARAPADAFQHVLWSQGWKSPQALGPAENVDVSVTHWAGQYTTAWPAVCGPGYGSNASAGKDCNIFHGDYTGLAVDSLGRAHVVWTGLNRTATSPQVDFYTGALHTGYVQDAMYARR